MVILIFFFLMQWILMMIQGRGKGVILERSHFLVLLTSVCEGNNFKKSY